MVIQNLLDAFNFLPLTQLPLVEVQFDKVDSYPPIQQLLTRICSFVEQGTQNEEISQSYQLLNEFISKEEETLGPKRFKRLVQSVFNIIVQYLLNVLREQSQQGSSVYFHLTYYKKNCTKYVDKYSQCCMMVVGLIAGYRLCQWGGIEEKIKQIRLGLKQLSKSEQNYNTSIVLNRLCSLIEACTNYHLESLKKAKDLCSKIINTSSLQSISAIKSHKEPSSIVKLQLTLCSYTVMKIYQRLGNYQLHMFMMNKFLQYAKKFYSGGERFVQLVGGGGGEMREKQVRVRLTRLQEKIRRIQLTEQEEYNKYLTGNKNIKNKRTLSRSSSLYNMQQQQNSNLIKTNSYLSRPKQIFSLYKQSINTGIQKQPTQQQKKIRQNSTKQKFTIPMSSILKGKQSATNKLKLTKRAIKTNTISSNQFQTTLPRSISVSFQNDINKLAQTEPLSFNMNMKKQPINTRHQIQLKKSQQNRQQLQNLLILKDNKKNYYRLKQETLKYLSKESNQLKRMIRTKNTEINQIEQIKTHLTSQLDLQQLKKNIQQSINQQALLLKQINDNKWNHAQSLPQVKKINTYFRTFLMGIKYWHSKNVHSLVYGQMLNLSKVKILTVLRHKAHKKSKQVISQVTYRNIKHQVQYIKKQQSSNQFIYIMNIYQTQKGQNGINQQFQLSEEEYKIVKYQPFYFNYSISQQGKLIPFEKQLLQLSFKSIYYINKLIRKIKKYCLKNQPKLKYKRLQVAFNYHQGTKILNKNKKNLNQSQNQVFAIKSFVFVGIFLITIKQLNHQSNQNSTHFQLQNPKNSNDSPQITDNFLKTDSYTSNFLQIQSKFIDDSKKQHAQKLLQITIQKISDHRYQNENYNSKLFVKTTVLQKDYDELKIMQSALAQHMNNIFIKNTEKIIKIQKKCRRIIAQKDYEQRKQNIRVITYQHKRILFTLALDIQNNTNHFFIQKIPKFTLSNQTENARSIQEYQQFYDHDSQKSFDQNGKNLSLFIRHNVAFQSLQFLAKLQPKLQECTNFEEMYIRIQKFLKIKLIAGKLFCKSKDIRLFTDFQTQFKKKLCFATIKEKYLFRGKMHEGQIMYMLTVKDFSRIPRPYSLRIFTLESNSMISIDGQKIIYNKEKLLLESKIETINEAIQILGRNQFQICRVKVQPIVKKPNPRISMLSNYSFHSLQASREHIEEKVSSGGINRRISKNSMFTKFRHKALIKNQDIEAIKKLVDERNLSRSVNSSNQLSSRLSLVDPVMSDSSQDKETDKRSS